MTRPVLLAAILALSACAREEDATAGRGRWRDPSPHRVHRVAVAPGISLEVLDWGGHGPPVVMLAGLGDPAHTFDDFAPLLTDRFHVIGITRRGFGASSKPPAADVPTLVADIRAVLDKLKLGRVSLVGHSIAGDELTAFALAAPERCARMVYLDAAHDRSHLRDLLRSTPYPPPPPMTTADSASPVAVQAYIARTQGVTLPEAEIRANIVLDTAGRYVRDVTPDSVAFRLLGHLVRPDYRRITCPSLAIYNVADSVPQMFPGYPAMDSATRRQAEVFFRRFDDFARTQRNNFRRESTHGQVLEIHGGNHYVFISNKTEVLGWVRAFLLKPDTAAPRT